MVTIFFVLTILINEVMPAPSNAPEWVELYNPGPDAFDISGWYLDDDTHGGTQIVIPPDTIIAPASLHVITLTSAILNNTGDAVTLYDATGQLIDRIDFGSTKSTESIGRIPDGSDIILKIPPSPGQLNAPVAPTELPHTATPTLDTTIDPTHTPATEPSLTITPSTTWTPTLTRTPSATPTPSPTITESTTRTPSPTRTPSETRTPSPTKTPSATRTPSPTRTPSETRTPSMSKTPSHTPLVSFTRTPSLTRTPSPTKTLSRTRTPSLSKTPRPSRTPKNTQTPSLSKTPRPSRTPHRAAAQHEEQRGSEPPATTPVLGITGRAATPQLVVCPPAPSTLNNWALTATGHQITLPDSADCVTIDLPADAPATWHLTNPHGLVVATVDILAQYCAHDISECQPSPTTEHLAIHVDYQRPQATSIPATVTPSSTSTDRTDALAPQVPLSSPSTTSPSTIPLGMLLMLGGWIALKLLARPAPDVLYSESGEDAASSADSLSSESRKV